MKRAVLIGLLCLAGAACAAGKASAPAIWKVSDADNSLYLLGSFHALKSEDYPLSPAVNAAYADAERLAFEIAPDEMQSPDLPQRMQRAALLPAGQNLQGLLAEPTWQALTRWSAAHPDYPIAALQRLKPWYVALIVANTQSQAQGFEPGLGLDRQLMGRPESRRKPSIGLEKAEQQIALFSGMGLAAQRELLQEALQDSGQARNAELESLRRQWKAGNVAALERSTIDRMRREYPALYRSVNVERNRAWLPKLQAMLDAEHEVDTLVVVGALHLLGPDGLVQGLKDKGYRVERLQ